MSNHRIQRKTDLDLSFIKQKAFLPPHTRKEERKQGTKNEQSTIPSQLPALSEDPSNGHSYNSEGLGSTQAGDQSVADIRVTKLQESVHCG